LVCTYEETSWLTARARAQSRVTSSISIARPGSVLRTRSSAQVRGRDPASDHPLGIGEPFQLGVALRRRAATGKLAVVELPRCHKLYVGIAEGQPARIADQSKRQLRVGVLLVRIPAVESLVRPLVHGPRGDPRMPLAEGDERQAGTGLRGEDHSEWPLRRRRLSDRDVHLQESGQPRAIVPDLCASPKLREVDSLSGKPRPFALGCQAPRRARVETLDLLPPDVGIDPHRDPATVAARCRHDYPSPSEGRSPK
jgi:hypothetical protein